jgi:PiT family inorganic phosphate transporter
VSSSHALIGGYAGAAVAKAGWAAIIAAGWTKTLAFIVLAPLLGIVLGLALMIAGTWTFRRWSPFHLDRLFRRLQLLSAALYSLGHGGNDAQKTMGNHHRASGCFGTAVSVRGPALGDST